MSDDRKGIIEQMSSKELHLARGKLLMHVKNLMQVRDEMMKAGKALL